MKKNLLLTLALCLLAQWSVAQAPKWVEKAKRAVFSVVTYDESDKILNTGNGFFVTEDGIALSDYSLFKGAQRAVVINSEGTQMPVEVIMGANDMYDVVKFRVAISGKKVPALVVAPVAPTVGASIYLLPYSTQKDRSYTTGRAMSRQKAKESFTQSAMKKFLSQAGVTLIGGSIEEMPLAYKNIDRVMQPQETLVEVQGKFMPRIVRMNKE